MAARKTPPRKGEPGSGTPGPGRPKGSKNKYDIRRNARLVAMAGLSPLEYLIDVYRNAKLPIELRLDAAKAAAPYVHNRMPLQIGIDLPDDDQIIPPYLPRRTEIFMLESGEAEVLEEAPAVDGDPVVMVPVEVMTHKPNGNGHRNGSRNGKP